MRRGFRGARLRARRIRAPCRARGGQRRSTDGSATPNTLDGIVDNRGFTNHEMLDHLDLVHMNGRVYEPLLGKFLSADPILQDPMNGQSYNRYAYVFNNPTNLTDPTGFETQGAQCHFGSGSKSCAAGEGVGPLPDYNKANSQAAKTEKSDGKGNPSVDVKKPGVSGGKEATNGGTQDGRMTMPFLRSQYRSFRNLTRNLLSGMVGFCRLSPQKKPKRLRPFGTKTLMQPATPYIAFLKNWRHCLLSTRTRLCWSCL